MVIPRKELLNPAGGFARPAGQGGGDDVPVEDLGYEAAELLSLTSGEAKSLNKLAELAGIAATHPDLAELAEEEIAAGQGPLMTAVRGGGPVRSADTLDDGRWPQWAAGALRHGLRSCVYLVRGLPSTTLVLALFGVRPSVLDTDSVPVAEMLAQFGSAAFANTLVYGEAHRTATQLKDSVASRAVTDQAKGILMHALGCDADEALAYLRRESQRRHVKVTEVAARIIASHPGRGDPRRR
jgi:hypothetical protein